MKPFRAFLLLSFLVVVVFMFSYHLRQPSYWESVVQSQDAVAQVFSSSSSTHSIGNGDRTVDNSGQHSKPGENGESHFDQYPVLKQPIWSVPDPGSEMPPMDAFVLSKAMIEVRAEKNVIAVTFANFAFLDFVINWVKHLTEYEVSNILVGAMDSKLLEALFWKGVPVFNMGSNVSTIDVGWGSPQFHKMGREKVILVNTFLSFGYELLICDTDMIFFQNPLPYFERYQSADLLTSSDEVVNSVDDDRLEIWDRSGAAYNIGILYWRSTGRTRSFAKEWLLLLLENDEIWDQNGFDDLLREKLGPSVDNTSGLFYAHHGELKLGILPVSLFCNGHTFFIQELYKKLNLLPYAVHATFQFGGTEGKRHRLREAKHFYDPPEYYNTPGGYIIFNSSIPEALLNGGLHTVESHFNLVNYQLVQIRTAFSIASILNRTLILPSLWCRFDRLWYGHNGKLDGTKTHQPFLCPLDHVFDIHQMLAELDNLEFGPGIGFREYSFLENPLLPHEVKTSVLKVELCNEHSNGCSRQAMSPSAGVLKLPKNSTEYQLITTFDAYKDYKILQFSTAEDAFGGFSDVVREAKFKQRIKMYTGIWCCVLDKTPGHIYYDIYWDLKPNWRPLPPATPEDDHKPQ
ncbi:unnamed protein product [Sphagnum jensenii]|uniref:Nucleotide-diphospho-sugar transferase domain-containing protein n=1 Tax=Sphagnum jensenii TaxID=128206 RepID=A0ABP0VZW2_9BRYO